MVWGNTYIVRYILLVEIYYEPIHSIKYIPVDNEADRINRKVIKFLGAFSDREIEGAREAV